MTARMEAARSNGVIAKIILGLVALAVAGSVPMLIGHERAIGEQQVGMEALAKSLDEFKGEQRIANARHERLLISLMSMLREPMDDD